MASRFDRVARFVNEHYDNNGHDLYAWTTRKYGEVIEMDRLPADLRDAIRVPYEFVKNSVDWIGRSFEGKPFLAVHKDNGDGGASVLFFVSKGYGSRPGYEYEATVLAVNRGGRWYTMERLLPMVSRPMDLIDKDHDRDSEDMKEALEGFYRAAKAVDAARQAEHWAAERLWKAAMGYGGLPGWDDVREGLIGYDGRGPDWEAEESKIMLEDDPDDEDDDEE